MSYTLEQAKLDIARLQKDLNAYKRIIKAYPYLLDVRANLKLANEPTEDLHAATKAYADSDKVANLLASLPALQGAWAHDTIAADHRWFSYTPTITYGGGTTDPTSASITYARYSCIASVVMMRARIVITRGAGDRSYTDITLPSNFYVSNYSPGTAFQNVTSIGFDVCPTYCIDTNHVRVVHGAMTSDGSLNVFITYEVDNGS